MIVHGLLLPTYNASLLYPALGKASGTPLPTGLATRPPGMWETKEGDMEDTEQTPRNICTHWKVQETSSVTEKIRWTHPTSGMQTSTTGKIKGPFDRETLTPGSQNPNFRVHLSHKELGEGATSPFSQPGDQHRPEPQAAATMASLGLSPPCRMTTFYLTMNKTFSIQTKKQYGVTDLIQGWCKFSGYI